MNLSRTIIIGNSGAGKSWLAEQLARNTGAPWTDLDTIYWLTTGYHQPREREQALALACTAAAQDTWVIEGIYGWLAQAILEHATSLIWLSLQAQECCSNIRQRGKRGQASEQSFTELLAWADSYQSRDGSSSFTAHQRLYQSFTGSKICLQSRADINDLLSSLFPA